MNDKNTITFTVWIDPRLVESINVVESINGINSALSRFDSTKFCQQVKEAFRQATAIAQRLACPIVEARQAAETASAISAIPGSVILAIAVRHDLTIQEARERFQRYVETRSDWRTCYKRVIRGQVPKNWGIEAPDAQRLNHWDCNPDTYRLTSTGCVARSEVADVNPVAARRSFMDVFRAITDPVIEPAHLQPPTCSGCQHYHGRVYEGNWFCCAMHPYGAEGDRCGDWESEDQA